MPLHAAENRDVVLGFDVPQPHRVVLNKKMMIVRLYCHLLGLGVLSISQAQAQSQSLDN